MCDIFYPWTGQLRQATRREKIGFLWQKVMCYFGRHKWTKYTYIQVGWRRDLYRTRHCIGCLKHTFSDTGRHHV